jgi:hypothetical protein
VFLLPLSIGVGAGSLITGSLHDRLGRPTVYPLIGLAVTALVLAATAYLEPCLSTTALALFLGVAALFMGTVMVSVQVTVQVAPRFWSAAGGGSPYAADNLAGSGTKTSRSYSGSGVPVKRPGRRTTNATEGLNRWATWPSPTPTRR